MTSWRSLRSKTRIHTNFPIISSKHLVKKFRLTSLIWLEWIESKSENFCTNLSLKSNLSKISDKSIKSGSKNSGDIWTLTSCTIPFMTSILKIKWLFELLWMTSFGTSNVFDTWKIHSEFKKCFDITSKKLDHFSLIIYQNHVKTERAKSGRASPEKEHVM